MHCFNNVKLLNLSNCDDKNIHENIFRLIQIHCYDLTQWDSQHWWLTLFGWLVGWLVVFNVPLTARSFRDGTPIYCPLRRT